MFKLYRLPVVLALVALLFTASAQPVGATGTLGNILFPQRSKSADLEITKKALSSTVPQGGVARFSIEVENEGKIDAVDVVITDTIPTKEISGVTFNAAQSHPNCVVQGSAVKCTVGTLKAKQTVTYVVAFNIPSFAECKDKIKNVASVTTTTKDYFEYNNKSQTVSIEVQCPQPQCDDKIDNDGDGKIDFPFDKGCKDWKDNDEIDGVASSNSSRTSSSVSSAVSSSSKSSSISSQSSSTCSRVVLGITLHWRCSSSSSKTSSSVSSAMSSSSKSSSSSMVSSSSSSKISSSVSSSSKSSSSIVSSSSSSKSSSVSSASSASSVSSTSSSSSASSVQNLILNPSVETDGGNGNPENWFRGGWGANTATFTYPVTGRGGASAIEVTISAYTDGDAKWYFKDVPVTPGKEYQYADVYKSTGPHSVVVQYTDGGGVVSYEQIAVLPTSTTWQQFTGTFTPPAGTVSVTVFHLLQGVGTLTTDLFSLTSVIDSGPPPTSFDKGYVSLTFDDGWMSHYTNVRPMLNTAALKGSFYIMSTEMFNSAGDTSNLESYMNTVQSKQLQTDGHEVSAHTKTHADLVQASPAQRVDEIQGSRTDLLNTGFTPVDTFVYPYGAYNNDVIQVVKDAGFKGARSVEEGYNVRTTNDYALKVQNVLKTTTVDQMKTWINNAVANKTWLILVFHEVDSTPDDYGTTPQRLQEVVNYLNQQSVPVITMSQGLDKMQ